MRSLFAEPINVVFDSGAHLRYSVAESLTALRLDAELPTASPTASRCAFASGATAAVQEWPPRVHGPVEQAAQESGEIRWRRMHIRSAWHSLQVPAAAPC